MPKLSTKHQNQTAAMIGDFTGGLNTSVAEEFIEDNQLAECINFEVDFISKKLTTVLGTKDLMSTADYGEIVYSYWDNINNGLVAVTYEGDVLSISKDFSETIVLGQLTGTPDKITMCCWEDGVLIASGGKLQYAAKMSRNNPEWVMTDAVLYELKTLDTSPEQCFNVFIRSGRVLLNDKSELLYSGVGDEENWEQDANDPSAALFLEVGYKAGGNIVSVVPNSKDILIVKDNGLCFRIEGEYPDWKISEVSRELYCANKDSSCDIGNGTTIVLGNGLLQAVVTTQDYGDMKPSQIGQQVAMQIANLPKNTKLKYIPSLNQVWFITRTGYVLTYDVSTQSFYQRMFNAPVLDAISVGQTTYLVRKDRISVLDFNNGYIQDYGKPLTYRARFKTDLSLHQYLVKTEGFNITPLVKYHQRPDVTLEIGKVKILFPEKVQGDKLKQTVSEHQTAKDIEYEFDNMIHNRAVLTKTRKMFRDDRVRILLTGTSFPFILNFITYEKVEV